MLLSEDELLVQHMVRQFADERLAPRAASLDEKCEFPWDNLRGISDIGLFGLGIAEEYGGSGGSTRQMALVVEEMARGCAATSVIYIAHMHLCAMFIQMFGSENQKRKYLPALAKGDKVGAFALTEAGSGSDAAAMQTTFTKANGHYVLNGSKCFITNASEADVFVVLATQDKKRGTKGVEALIVERQTDGMTVNPQHGKMGVRGSSTAEVVFENSPVPTENIMSEKGEGFKNCMSVLSSSRISIAAQCVGIAQAAFEASVAYAKQRKAFGVPIGDFQAIQWMVADMATEIEAARLLVQNVAMLKDRGLPFVRQASMAKLFASQVATSTTDKAIQIHGGSGYFSPAPVERYFRDARVTEIYEGTSEIQRLIIARSILTESTL